jgi:hypothetical protein
MIIIRVKKTLEIYKLPILIEGFLLIKKNNNKQQLLTIYKMPICIFKIKKFYNNNSNKLINI